MDGNSVDVLIVDDHALMGDALATLLARIRPEWRSQQIASGEAALEHLAANKNIKLVLLDLFMPGMDGFELISKINEFDPLIPIVNISASEKPQHITRAIQLGSRAYIPKSSPTEVIAGAIESVLAGHQYIPPGISLEGNYDDDYPFDMNDRDKTLSDIRSRLTERQLQIFYLLGQGKSNKEIAQDLYISTNTVKIHVSAILKTLSLNNRAQTGIISKMLQDRENHEKQVY